MTTTRELDLIARRQESALTAIEQAQMLALKARASLPDGLTRSLSTANTAVQDAIRAARVIGAVCERTPPATVVPLHLLDTPATRRFLELLREVRDAAEAVDRERGWVIGDNVGCGYTDSIESLIVKVEPEVEAPRGME